RSVSKGCALRGTTHVLSLRRRLGDCGNPRDWRDQMDRHVASLLAMTNRGGTIRKGWPRRACDGLSDPSPDNRSVSKGCAPRGPTHVCHCEGGLASVAIQGIGGIRW